MLLHDLGMVLCGIGLLLAAVALLMMFANSGATLLEYRDYEPRHKAAFFLLPGFGTLFNKAKDPRQQKLMDKRAKMLSICIILAPIFGLIGFIMTYLQP